MTQEPPTLRQYEAPMRLRHARSLAAAIVGDPELARDTVVSEAIARFVVDAFSMARDAEDPYGAVDEVFELIEAAWDAAGAPR